MHTYHQLLRYVLDNGERVPTRAKLLSTGANIDALSVFGYQCRYSLREGFPAVTTKRLSFHSVKHELLWMLSGSTNVQYLRDNRVTIWDEWADATGDIGPAYGYQMRSWPVVEFAVRGSKDTPGVPARVTYVDQMSLLVDGIREVRENPAASVGRRLLVNLWNVGDVPAMRLPPCHLLSQYLVRNGRLHCHLYQRSADAFLGVPFNIAQYALLTHMLAQVCELEVGDLVHSFGDLHLYTNHLDAVREQLSRTPYAAPTLRLTPTVKDLFAFQGKDIELIGYRHHDALFGEVAV